MRAGLGLASVAVLAFLSTATAVPTNPSDLQVGRIVLEGDAIHSGEVGLLTVRGPLEAEAALSWLKLEAESIRVERMTDRGLSVETWNGDGVNTVRALNSAYPSTNTTTWDASPGELRFLGAQPGFILNLAASPDSTVTTDLARGEYSPIRDPVLHGLGLAPLAPGNAPNSESSYFTEHRLHGTHIQLALGDRPFSMTLAGDFVLELTGVDLALESADGSQTLESGMRESDVGMMPGSIQQREDAFLRIHATAGRLELAVDEGVADAAYTMSSLTGATEGRLTFIDAIGVAHDVQGDEVRLDGERWTVEGATLAAVPRSGYLSAHVTPPPTTQDGTFVGVPGGIVPSLLIGSAVLAALAGVLVVALRRNDVPRLDQMEAALTRGDFAGAARLANAILRRSPGLEDAMLGRAIALSKSGQPTKVISEVSAQIRRRDPSDGVLHYVLGLAYLDVGRKAEGETALREAMRRTPALRAEVAPRLGLPVMPSAPLPKIDPEGYV